MHPLVSRRRGVAGNQHGEAPPLVAELRRKVKEFRNGGYVGAADTIRSLLNWWFNTPHLLPKADGTMAEFQYYFAQREALETIVYLYDVAGVQDKHDLMRYDASGLVSGSMFDETWRRFVVKMATANWNFGLPDFWRIAAMVRGRQPGADRCEIRLRLRGRG